MVQDTINRMTQHGYVLQRDDDTIIAEAKHGGSIEISLDEAEAVVALDASVPMREAEPVAVENGYVRTDSEGQLDAHFTSDDGEVRSRANGNHLVSIRRDDLLTLLGVEA